MSRTAPPATAPVPGLLVPVLLALALVAGCTAPGQPTAGQPSAGQPSAGQPSAPDYDSYVALGDSFTAAPFVPTTDLAQGCLRSDGNYPALLAERLRITDVTDVSCSGAGTVDLTSAQPTVGDTRVPPQLDAVEAGTDLVTVGIGGNDFNLFGTLVGACARLQARPSSGSCAEALSARGVDVFARARRIRGRVAAAVGAIGARAPEATVVLVGYPRLTPDRGTCAQLPFGAADRSWAQRVERALRAALRQAAADSGAVFADVYAASAGHDVCAAVPWVNGRRTDRRRALAFHPFAEGQEAAAEVVAAALDRHARRTP